MPRQELLRTWRIALAGAAMLLLGCGHLGVDRFFSGKVEMTVLVDPDLNANSPVAVELLVVYDAKLLASLEAMTAASWFAQRQQLLQQYSEVEHKLDAWMWEWVPGQVVPEERRRFKIGARGALIFANYFSPGTHRASVDPFKPFRLHLQATDFDVESLR